MVQYPVVVGPKGESGRVRRYLTVVRPRAGKGRRMFEELVRRLPDREFFVVGGGRLDIPWERVAYLPSALNMHEVYAATRILLQPATNPEAFGRTVAEAAAHGIPSVVSNQGGLPEALGPGGIAVNDFENVNAWAEAIKRIESDYDKYAAQALEHSERFRSIGPLLDALAEQMNREGAVPAGARLHAA
jgi:glycosyltransferase involved in cell wall biosynthesis